MVSENPSPSLEFTQYSGINIPYQSPLPEFGLPYRPHCESPQVASRERTKVLTYKDVELQPYLIPFSILDRSQQLLCNIETYLNTPVDDSNAQTFEKGSILDTLAGEVRNMPAYHVPEDDVALRLPNPLTVSLDVAYGNLHTLWSK